MRELVKQAVRGDKEAFAQLVTAYSQDLYKIARSILSNEEDVADAVQETILRCYEKISTLKNPRYFKTWMIRILINQSRDMLRERKHEWAGELYISEVGSSEEMDHWEFLQILHSLDEKYRLIVILHYVEGYRVREIADILDMPQSTVKTRLSRGRQALREIYKGSSLPQEKTAENGEHFFRLI